MKLQKKPENEFDGCEANANEDPIFEVRDEVLANKIQENHENPQSCPRSDGLSSKMAEINNKLRNYDSQAEKLNKLHTITKRYDDPWEMPDHNQFGLWKSMIEEFQDDLINPRIMTKKKIKEWIEYVVNKEDPASSRIR